MQEIDFTTYGYRYSRDSNIVYKTLDNLNEKTKKWFSGIYNKLPTVRPQPHALGIFATIIATDLLGVGLSCDIYRFGFPPSAISGLTLIGSVATAAGIASNFKLSKRL